MCTGRRKGIAGYTRMYSCVQGGELGTLECFQVDGGEVGRVGVTECFHV